MDSESLNIYDDRGKYLGVSSREEVHTKGHWHETFHCWAISRKEERAYIHFQIRCQRKKDFPNLLDVYAAGHILSNESISDGIREIEEELGIKVSFSDLISLGTFKDEIIRGAFIDRELVHAFLFVINEKIEDQYNFQPEEVSGVLKVELNAFCALWFGRSHQIQVSGIEVNSLGKKEKVNKIIKKKCFLPHDEFYLVKILERIDQKLKKNCNLY